MPLQLHYWRHANEQKFLLACYTFLPLVLLYSQPFRSSANEQDALLQSPGNRLQMRRLYLHRQLNKQKENSRHQKLQQDQVESAFCEDLASADYDREWLCQFSLQATLPFRTRPHNCSIEILSWLFHFSAFLPADEFLRELFAIIHYQLPPTHRQ